MQLEFRDILYLKLKVKSNLIGIKRDAGHDSTIPLCHALLKKAIS